MRPPLRPLRKALVRLAVAGLTAVLLTITSAGRGYADTPTPTPTSSTTPTPTTSAAAPTQSTTPTAPTADPKAGSSSTPGADPGRRSTPQAGQAAGFTLTVKSTYGSGNSFWSDIGTYAFRGTAGGVANRGPVEIYERSGSAGWSRLSTATVDSGSYALDYPVLSSGTYTFVATSGGAPGTGDAVTSNSVTVPVKAPTITFDRPVIRIDSLKNPRLTGSIGPARPGVTVDIELLRHGRFRKIDDATTDAEGRFALSLGYGRGSLASYRIRAAYRLPNRGPLVASSSHRFTRIAVLNGTVSRTTAADVATTYHPGCPVGPSELRTVRMNYYGLDSKMHRGVLVVRSDLTGKIKYAFARSLHARFRITRMNNPNAYGGNDPRQMAADNSSGFNCRRVVGNPYRMSPHSYGIAIDVNARQNPYRDVTGKWWPANGRKYIDRTPRRLGMLNATSTLVRTLGKDGFFWGGRWNPGRDYQHFQY